jgi:hypothetical protein
MNPAPRIKKNRLHPAEAAAQEVREAMKNIVLPAAALC